MMNIWIWFFSELVENARYTFHLWAKPLILATANMTLVVMLWLTAYQILLLWYAYIYIYTVYTVYMYIIICIWSHQFSLYYIGYMHLSYPVAILYCISQLHQSLLIYQLILNNHICIWKQSSILSIFFIYQSITVVDDMCCYFMSSTYTVIRQITELNPIDNIASHYVCIYI